MRPQASPIQESGDQKKSVFDRLGRQLDTRSVNRGSPVHYGEHPVHQVMHEADFGRFGRPEQHHDMSWRYQTDRRHVQFSRDRHQPPVGQYPPEFDMNIPQGRQPPQYFPHPHPSHQPQYHSNPGVQPPLMGTEALSMGMHQRRPSPKYDRHGNPIHGSMRMDPTGMTPSANYMVAPLPGPMMHPTGYDMIPMNPAMYQHSRWPQGPEMGPAMQARVQHDDRFMEVQRFHQQQTKPPVMMNPDPSGRQPNFEAPRYSKWRERRDAITNLDRQTAQSSSKTDSLKSSLKQHEGRHRSRRHRRGRGNSGAKRASPKKEQNNPTIVVPKIKQSVAPKIDPSEISDGEIIDDEDSSDESESQKVNNLKEGLVRPSETLIRKTPYGRIPAESQQYYDIKKRRRLHVRDDYPMDYETISDEELDDFMSDKKLVEESKLDGSAENKSSSEIELLNALGLDWANLIELSKQSKKETPTSGSAVRRFSMPNYLPTLGITRDLAGPEIHDFILKACH